MAAAINVLLKQPTISIINKSTDCILVFHLKKESYSIALYVHFRLSSLQQADLVWVCCGALPQHKYITD